MLSKSLRSSLRIMCQPKPRCQSQLQRSASVSAFNQNVDQVRSYMAAVCTSYDTALEVKDMSKVLKPSDRELLLQVDTAGFNNADMSLIKGTYHLRPNPPIVPGFELAGEVIGVGFKVTDFKKGDRVLGVKSFAQGAFAEQCLLNVDEAYLIPHSVPYELAASMPVAYGTAYLALSRVVQVKEGEYVLVLSSQGATGVACIDLAVNVYKCNVIAATESEEKCAMVRPMGVLSTVEYTDENLPKLVNQITTGKGVDLIIDTVGGFWFDLALKCLRPGGRLITTGYSSNQVPTVSMQDLIKYAVSITGVRLSALPRNEVHSILERMIDWHDQGYLQVLQPKVFELADINSAIKHITKERSFGKVVLNCRRTTQPDKSGATVETRSGEK